MQTFNYNARHIRAKLSFPRPLTLIRRRATPARDKTPVGGERENGWMEGLRGKDLPRGPAGGTRRYVNEMKPARGFPASRHAFRARARALEEETLPRVPMRRKRGGIVTARRVSAENT